MDLSNREIATAIWLLIFFGLVALQNEVREAFRGVMRAFFVQMILLSLAAATAYIAVCVVALAKLNIWQWYNLKTTLIWAATFAFVTMFDINRISEDDKFFRKAVRDTVSATAIVLFVAETYTFGLLIELILVPFLTCAFTLQAVATLKPDHHRVSKLISWVLGVAVVVMLTAAFYQAAADFRNFATLKNTREFFIPILLSLMFLPFIYLFSTYVIYERIFVRTDWAINDPKVRAYAKLHAFFAYFIDHDALKRWARAVTLTRPKNYDDIRKLIREIKLTKKREQNPPTVPRRDGWSPYIAKDFLVSEGIATIDHHQSYDEWFAESKPFKIDDSILSNTISYYVLGNAFAAKCLKLKLNVTNFNDAGSSDIRFYELAELLLNKAISEDKANSINARLHRSESFSASADGKRIILKKESYTSNRGYFRTLIIEVPEAQRG